MGKIEDLRHWMNHIIPAGGVFENYVRTERVVDAPSPTVRFHLLLLRCRYVVTAVERPVDGFLGAEAFWHHRPKKDDVDMEPPQMPSGTLTRQTWDRIVRAIVAAELCRRDKGKGKETDE